jgi:hypothetical protein
MLRSKRRRLDNGESGFDAESNGKNGNITNSVFMG